jgi:hypothetical protein
MWQQSIRAVEVYTFISVHLLAHPAMNDRVACADFADVDDGVRIVTKLVDTPHDKTQGWAYPSW